LEEEVEELEIFCDSDGGQNKNYTIFRFIHYIVNCVKSLQTIKITFPVRGHSYLECDKNVGLWNLKKRMETMDDFTNMILESRAKPSPFIVINVGQEMVYDWKSLLDGKYVRKCPFKMQPIKEVSASSTHPRLLTWRSSYNGPHITDVIAPRKPIKNAGALENGEFELPQLSYSGNYTILITTIIYEIN
jgi:hypothetical protein